MHAWLTSFLPAVCTFSWLLYSTLYWTLDCSLYFALRGTLYCTLYTLIHITYNGWLKSHVYCTLCTVHLTTLSLYTVHCTLYYIITNDGWLKSLIPWGTLSSLHAVNCTKHFTVYCKLQCTINCGVQCTVHFSVHFTLHRTVYFSIKLLNNVQYIILYTYVQVSGGSGLFSKQHSPVPVFCNL